MGKNRDDLQGEEIEFMDLEDEDDQDYRQDSRDDDWEDEPEPMKPWVMALIFAGLVVLAAIICAILWRFTHNEAQNPDGAGNGIVAESPAAAEPDDPQTAPEEGPIASVDGTQGDGGADGGDSSDLNQPEASTEPSDQPVSTPEAEDMPKEPEDGDTSMSFNAMQDSVTPKDMVNLRSVPSTLDENTVVLQVSNGEVLSRTGVNPDTGWSRIDYNGQILYAVTQYLTTDLNYKTPVQPSNPNRVSTTSGRIIIFVDCDDTMTPKEYVNLRTEPSTAEGDATVRCQVENGEVVRRTGYSADSGWSRVEYNGEVLYVVTSLMLPQ